MSHKDRLVSWMPGKSVVGENEALENYLFKGVSPDKFTASWLRIEKDIKDLAKCARLEYKGKREKERKEEERKRNERKEEQRKKIGKGYFAHVFGYLLFVRRGRDDSEDG